MNKYLWAECPVDEWPSIKTIVARSYNDAVEKIIIRYGEILEDDKIYNTLDDWNQLQEYLNNEYTIAISELEELDELFE